MATKVTVATGNFTAAGTWQTCDSGFELDSNLANTAVTTSYVGHTAVTTGIITIDCLYVKIFSRSASPTGTFSIELYNSTLGAQVANTETTVNVADLPTSGWVGFPTNGDVVLLAATNYQIRVKTSSGSMVNLYRNATANNWSRQLRTTTSAAPASTDKLHCAGELTGAGTGNSFVVTIENTATTSFGVVGVESFTINKRASVLFATTASTNFYLKLKGIMRVFDGGLWDYASVPSTSTAIIEFDCTVSADSGIQIGSGGIFRSSGVVKSNNRTLLTSNMAAASAIANVVSTTDFAVNDEVAFSATGTTVAQYEKRIISTVPSATQFTTTVNVTNAHNGTSPTQGYVANLTRNVKIRGISSSLNGFITKESGGTLQLSGVECYNLGSSTASRRGIEHAGTGTFEITDCSIHDCTVSSASGILIATGADGTFIVDNNNFYNCNANSITINGALTATTWQITNNLVIATTSGSAGISLGDVGGTVTGNIVTGTASGAGIALSESDAVLGTVSDNTSFSNSANGLSMLGGIGIVSNTTTWRNLSNGIIHTSGEVTYTNHVGFGNVTSNFSFSSGVVEINSPVWNAGVTNTCPVGLSIIGSGIVRVNDASMGATSTHSTGDVQVLTSNNGVLCYFNNSVFISSTEVATQTRLTPSSFIGSEKHDGTDGLHKAWLKYGNHIIDTTIFDTTPSLRMTPNNAAGKLESVPFKIAVADNASVSLSIKVRESVAGDGTDYNGNPIRLIVKKNVSLGISDDTVLATATASSQGAFETISGTTATVTDDGVLEFYCDCDGTTGWVNIDTVVITSSATDTTGFKYWMDGYPVIYGDNQLGGGGSFAFA